MNLLESLKSYEAVLLVCGIALFVVSLGSLIFFVAKQRGIASLGVFFIISIAMIAYPSIKKIQVGENTIETINEKTKELTENPHDDSARKVLQENLAHLEGRRITNPRTLTIVAKGHAALGDTTKALESVNKALVRNPRDQRTLDLRRQLEK